MVHDGEYRIEPRPDGTFQLMRPSGEAIPEVPPMPKLPDEPLPELSMELEGWEGKPKWGYEPITSEQIGWMWTPNT